MKNEGAAYYAKQGSRRADFWTLLHPPYTAWNLSYLVAGLALLLEWVTWANHSVREIRFTGMPEKILAIARTTEVEHLLARGERWSGFIDAPDGF